MQLFSRNGEIHMRGGVEGAQSLMVILQNVLYKLGKKVMELDELFLPWI